MRKNKLLSILFKSFLLGFLTYFCVCGLQSTHFFSFIPFIDTFIQGISTSQNLMLSSLVAITFFSLNYFTKTMASVITAICIFLILFNFQDLFHYIIDPIRGLVGL